MNKIDVVQKPGEEIPAQILAQSIVKISAAADALLKAGLNLKAVKLLLSHSSGVNQRDVQAVLWAMQTLKENYLTKPKVAK